MVLGNGLVARGFSEYKDKDDYLIFASGLSNSANTDPAAFLREKNLLISTIRRHEQKTIVYFSTCSIYDPALKQGPYVSHKLAMENIIQRQHGSYHIFRISNLVGPSDNPHTVINFFVQHIQSGAFFQLWKNASRNIIDLEDAVAICDYMIKNRYHKNEVVNVANALNYPVTAIVNCIENIIGKTGNYELIEKGDDPHINIDVINEFLKKLKIRFDNNYLERTIRKYFVAK